MRHIDPSNDEISKAVVQLSREICPLLSGQRTDVTGPALADVVSIFIVSFPSEQREAILKSWLRLVRELMAVNAQYVPIQNEYLQ